MTLKLTERDKRLLYLLAIIVVAFVLLNFCILPELYLSMELADNVSMAEMSLFEQHSKVDSVENKLTLNAKYREQLQAEGANFSEPRTNDAVDDLITGLMVAHQMEPRNLNIRRGVITEVAPYVLSEYAAKRLNAQTETVPMEQMIEGAVPIPRETVEAEPNPDLLPIISVECSAQGTQANLMALLDTIDQKHPYIGVRGFAIESVQVSDPAMESGLREQTELSLSLELYCFNPPEEVVQ